MHLTALRNIAFAGLACGLALYAGEVWNTKDSAQWTDDEVEKILNDSPWAKRAKLSFDRSTMDDSGGGQSRGSGYPGGGGGYPGGGGGPLGTGGGGPLGGGGIGFPGGGMGRRGGGGQGGQRNPGGRGMAPMEVTMRWESAAPIQDALSRSGGAVAADKESYVLAVLGLRMPDRRGAGDDSDDTRRDPERMRNRLMSASRLLIKGRSSIAPSDVKVSTDFGHNEVRFFFPKTNPISRDDKEIVFETQLGPMKLEQKFHVKDMMYKGKLAI